MDLIDLLSKTDAPAEPVLEQPYDSLGDDTDLPKPIEFVVDPRTGSIRQAGSDVSDTSYLAGFRKLAEQHLYVFARSVLGLDRLTPTLHLDVCKFLQKKPPFRKLVLLPRDHLKTSIVSRALPMHILIQPRDSNVYFADKQGSSTRILLANETAANAENQLGWIAAKFETSPLIRAFWPHVVWENSRRQSRKWNSQAIILRRDDDYPEASIETFGVGGAVTGRHYDVLIKDDLISVEAANSPTVMQTAIQWHIASRALLDDPAKSMEFIIGTRWAVHDLYEEIMTNDPTVEPYVRSVIENGKPIFPEMFPPDVIEEKRKRFGVLFPLLYMNSAADPSLTDFDPEQLREFRIVGETLEFDEDERDMLLLERNEPPIPLGASRGVTLTRDMKRDFFRRSGSGEYLRLKYG